MRHFHRVAIAAAAVGFLGGAGAALAVVETIDATVQSGVLQFLPDGVVNSDSAFENLDETTSNLPLTAEARLVQADPESAILSSAIAATIFSDPRASETENPMEFALDVVAFSVDPVVDYEATGAATETRSIVFTSEEIGAENGSELLVTSHFFVDGFMVIWGDLDPVVGPTRAQMRVRVHQTRPGEDRRVVMEATLSLSQSSDLTPLVTADGGISTDNIVLINTLGSILPLGDAFLVLLPEMSIPYTYETVVGETFTLDADVECVVENQPYTGAGITLGLPLDHFLGTIGDVIGDELSDADVFRTTNGSAPSAAKPLHSGKGTSVQVLGAPVNSSFARVLPCGVLGVESLLMAACCPFLFLLVPRRR